jgi:hypothetical protein
MSFYVVTLTAREAIDVWHAAQRYRASLRATGRRDTFALATRPDLDTVRKYLGYAGEKAFCKWLDVPWQPWLQEGGDTSNPDVLPDWEIRTRAHEGDDLAMRDHDKDGRRFVLVWRGRRGCDYVLVGWLPGDVAKRLGVRGHSGGRPILYTPWRCLFRFEAMSA